MMENSNIEENTVQENDFEQGTMQGKKKFGESVKGLAGVVGEKAGIVAKKSTEMVDKSKEAVFKAIDVNGDGQIDIEDVILMAFKVPGVSINRENFLQKELLTKYPQEIIDQAVLTTPMKANISQDDIEKIERRHEKSSEIVSKNRAFYEVLSQKSLNDK